MRKRLKTNYTRKTANRNTHLFYTDDDVKCIAFTAKHIGKIFRRIAYEILRALSMHKFIKNKHECNCGETI